MKNITQRPQLTVTKSNPKLVQKKKEKSKNENPDLNLKKHQMQN